MSRTDRAVQEFKQALSKADTATIERASMIIGQKTMKTRKPQRVVRRRYADVERTVRYEYV